MEFFVVLENVYLPTYHISRTLRRFLNYRQHVISANAQIWYVGRAVTIKVVYTQCQKIIDFFI